MNVLLTILQWFLVWFFAALLVAVIFFNLRGVRDR